MQKEFKDNPLTEDKIVLNRIKPGECFSKSNGPGTGVYMRIITDKIPIINLETGKISYIPNTAKVFPLDVRLVEGGFDK